MIGQDRANFAGALIEASLYGKPFDIDVPKDYTLTFLPGILVILTGLCVHYLKADMQHHRTHSLIMLSFVVMFFTLGTLGMLLLSWLYLPSSPHPSLHCKLDYG
jgi:hypothetical protein